jgi:hypothetical protein
MRELNTYYLFFGLRLFFILSPEGDEDTGEIAPNKLVLFPPHVDHDTFRGQTLSYPLKVRPVAPYICRVVNSRRILRSSRPRLSEFL